jgi:carbamoylphosphate synthase small subunit
MDAKTRLWQVFKEKVISEWDEKYGFVGDSIEDRKNAKIGFAGAVSEDMQKKLGETVSKDRLNDFFANDGIVGDSKFKTLDRMARYVGYIGWVDFKKKSETVTIEETVEEKKEETVEETVETVDIIESQPDETPIETETNELMTTKWAYVLVAIVTFLLIAYFKSIVSLHHILTLLAFIVGLWFMGFLFIRDINEN